MKLSSMAFLRGRTMLILYSTLGCHLCDQAEQTLLAAGIKKDEIDLVDIADSPALMDKYATSIPVVKDKQTQAEIFWPFDVGQVIQWWNNLA